VETIAADLISNPVPDAARILVVDDQEPICTFLQRLLQLHGYEVVLASDGQSALAAVASVRPDVILLDIGLPDTDGFHVCRRLRQDRETRLTPVIFITGRNDREQRVQGLACGADDFLTKPVDSQELLARVRSLVRMKRYTDDLDSAASFILMLADMIETRDGHGQGHCHRMANYATALGRAMELDNRDVQTLHRGGFLHDLGMLAVSDSVLRNPGTLSPAEYELVKSHTVVGDAWCSELRSLQPVRPIIRSHHERRDGSGYPDGLRGDDIPLLAQIMGVVDVYEALTADRPYQQRRSPEETADVLRLHVANGWRRRDIVETFIGLVQSGALDEVPTTLPLA
jgi:putative two-component system response regulator